MVGEAAVKRTALKRKRRMRRGKHLKVRRRLRERGARAERDHEALLRFRADVLRAAGYRCERCGYNGDLFAHHIKPRARGGTHRRDNGAALCFRCHEAVHTHAAGDWRSWLA